MVYWFLWLFEHQFILGYRFMSSEKDTKEHEQSEVSQTAEAQTESNACDQACTEVKDKFLRVTADFQNYRSRVEKERMYSIQLGQIAVLGKLLSIVDDVDRAIDEAKKQEGADTSWLAGFELIAKSLSQLLADHQIMPIEQIETFDPELHEALAQIDSPDHTSGMIIEVMQKGYRVGDRVLRPAKVTVSK